MARGGGIIYYKSDGVQIGYGNYYMGKQNYPVLNAIEDLGISNITKPGYKLTGWISTGMAYQGPITSTTVICDVCNDCDSGCVEAVRELDIPKVIIHGSVTTKKAIKTITPNK